jgi:predicted O-methyltransferase YrrM
MTPDWVGLAQGAPSATEFDVAAFDALDRAIGFDVAFMAVKGDERRAAGRGLDAGAVMRRFAPGSSYETELLPVKTAALGRRGVAVDTEVLGSSAARCAYFRDIVAPLGGRHSLVAYLRLRGVPFGTVVLGRTGSAFSSRDVTAMENALPALSLARASYGCAYSSEERALVAPPANLGARLRRWTSNGELARGRLEDGTVVIVRDVRGRREMVCESGGRELVWSRAEVSAPSRSGWPYIDLLHVAAALAGRPARALFVGCGGGVVLRQFARTYPGIALDVVERERTVIELAREWFGLTEIPNLAVHVGDGIDFVARAPEAAWDVIVVDAYGSDPVVDERLASPAFFASLRRALSPAGSVACNVIGSLGAGGTMRAIVDSARGAFNGVRLVPVIEADEAELAGALRNVVVVATP